MRRRTEKGEAPVIGPTGASGEANPLIKESNVTDSTDSSLVQAITPETVPAITWEGARVITTELLARLYETDEVRIRQNYTRNADRFEVGKHFVKLEGEALRELKQQQGISKILSRARSAILWTERGAARHAKMLETDAAWEVFERLEDCYFTVKAVLARAAYAVHPDQTLSAEQADTLRFMLTENVKRLPKEKQAGAMVKGWSKLKAHFKTDYRHIPAGEFHEAVSILARHVAEWELVDDTPKPAKQPTVQEIVADWVKKIEEANGYPAFLFQPLVEAVLRKSGKRLAVVAPGQMMVDRRNLAAVWADLGKLQSRIDAMGCPAQDFPPSWWEDHAIAA